MSFANLQTYDPADDAAVKTDSPLGNTDGKLGDMLSCETPRIESARVELIANRALPMPEPRNKEDSQVPKAIPQHT